MLYIVTHIHLCGDNKKTNKLIAPYRENYVHRILFFYVRISLTSTIKDRPVRIQQVDRHGRSNYKPNQNFSDPSSEYGKHTRKGKYL